MAKPVFPGYVYVLGKKLLWGQGDLKEVWLGLCCCNPSILTLIKAKCIKIATLFKTLNIETEYFF